MTFAISICIYNKRFMISFLTTFLLMSFYALRTNKLYTCLVRSYQWMAKHYNISNTF